MPIPVNLAIAKPTYDQGNEQQMRQQIILAFNALNQPSATATYVLKDPDVINQGCAWMRIDDGTLVATLFYLDTGGVTRSLVLGTLT